MSDAATHPLARYGWSDRVQSLFDAHAPEGSTPGRVVRVDRILARVMTADGEVAARGFPLPAVGDWVALVPPADDAEFTDLVVAEVMPRWSVLERLDPLSSRQDVDTVQVLAANVDVVMICAPLDREVSIARIERELVVAWHSGARPLVVLTKADRNPTAAGILADLRERLVGVEVVSTAARTGDGIDEVRAAVPLGFTGALLGASGAGKSTLTNALLGDEVMATGAVRDLDQRGTHTTTVRQMLPIPGAGVLIDAPGVRSMGIGMADEGLALAFPEITAAAESCRFRNCTHDHEPGCAVVAALGAGNLDMLRFENWRKLAAEIAASERRTDPHYSAAARRTSKTEQRRRQRNRP